MKRLFKTFSIFCLACVLVFFVSNSITVVNIVKRL